MSEYTSACDTVCDIEYGQGGGYREFSYAGWCWNEIENALAPFSNADELWDVLCADIEGAYFADGYGEQAINGTDMSVAVERVVDTYGAFDASYLRIVKNGEIVLEVSAESDSETDATSGISVLCDYLWDRISR